MAASARSLTGGQRFSLATVKVSDIGWLLVFNLALFAAPIQNTFGFSYIDEIVTLLAVLLYARKSHEERNSPFMRAYGSKCIGCLLIVALLGLVGNLFSGLKTSPTAIAIDLFACLKMPIALICLFAAIGDRRRLFRFIEMECKVFAIVLLFFGAVNLFIDIPNFSAEVRYGFRSFRFVFEHPEVMVFICVGMAVVLCANFEKNRLWIVAFAFIACFSLRTKGLVFAAVAVFLVFTWGHEGRFKVWHLLTGFLVALLIGWDQYQAYYQTDGIARNELAKAAIQIANTYFPFGSGFASFGSNITATPEYYSSLYYYFHLNTVYGLAPTNPAFLSDTFWPIIIGQFGWLGLVIYSVALLYLAKYAYQSASTGGSRLSVVLCFVFLFISSTAESAFFNPHSLFLTICLAFSVVCARHVVDVEED